VIIIILVFALFLLTIDASAQHQHHPPEDPKPQEHTSHDSETTTEQNQATKFLLSEGAGSATNPESAFMAMPARKIGNWNLMTHAYAFLNNIQQTGPRGGDRTFSSNHLMFIGSREINERSTFFVRTMFSFEPATVEDRQYPLLFQTGETAFDEPIVDGQHPHDLFMELSVQYAIQLNDDTLLHFYGAPVGDPALGPVAFPHRLSAQELPQATLSHHLQDSTHIAVDVLTAGIKYKSVRWEFGGFHGSEPDEGRWDIDQGPINSWATRLTLTPAPEWSAQVSTGRLKDPEIHEPGDIHRTTASVTNYTPISEGFWATSVIWGQNKKIELDRYLNSYSFETLYQFKRDNSLTGRIEIVDKDELFPHDDDEHEASELEEEIFRVKSFTFGYARDFNLIPGLRTGIGANMTLYSFPSALESFYGDSPKSFLFYFRIGSAHHSQHSAEMPHH
jgi:hypothetical protein